MSTTNSITDASHRLCLALHESNIDPGSIEIHLPRDEWWRLWNRLEQLHLDVIHFDGRSAMPERFYYMGVCYRVKK